MAAGMALQTLHRGNSRASKQAGPQSAFYKAGPECSAPCNLKGLQQQVAQCQNAQSQTSS
eukprot:scaffold104513_cov17-Tisochrysis_lutea.AAC.1